MSTIKQKHQELIEQAEALLAKAKEMEHLIEDEGETTIPSKELFGIVKKVTKDKDTIDLLTDGWYSIGQDGLGEWYEELQVDAADSPVFATEEAAHNWADAFAVMMELRCQDGVVNRVNDDDGVFTLYLDYEDNTLCSDMIYPSCLEGSLSPYFDTREQAQKAIDNVGKERIIKAIKTISGVK